MKKEIKSEPCDIWAGESVPLTEELINGIPEIKNMIEKFESFEESTLIVQKVCTDTKTITFDFRKQN